MFVWQFDSVLLKYPWRTSNCSSALIPALPCGCPERSHVRVKQRAPTAWSAWLLESFEIWFALTGLPIWERKTDTISNFNSGRGRENKKLLSGGQTLLQGAVRLLSLGARDEEFPGFSAQR